MKKVYTKPELFCEEYELSVSIAGNCGAQFSAFNVNTSSITTCTYRDVDEFIFIQANAACTEHPAYDDDLLCYVTATEGSLAFSS